MKQHWVRLQLFTYDVKYLNRFFLSKPCPVSMTSLDLADNASLSLSSVAKYLHTESTHHAKNTILTNSHDKLWEKFYDIYKITSQDVKIVLERTWGSFQITKSLNRHDIVFIYTKRIMVLKTYMLLTGHRLIPEWQQEIHLLDINWIYINHSFVDSSLEGMNTWSQLHACSWINNKSLHHMTVTINDNNDITASVAMDTTPMPKQP